MAALKCIVLNEIVTSYVTSFTEHSEKGNILGEENRSQWLLGWGEELTPKGHRGLGNDRALLYLSCGHSYTIYVLVTAGELYAIRMNFAECKLYLNLKLKNGLEEKMLLLQNRSWKSPKVL